MLVHDKFKDNPLVCADPGVRSYLGYTLQSRDGLNLGTLCVMDTEARKFTDENKFNLTVVGEVANRLLLGTVG